MSHKAKINIWIRESPSGLDDLYKSIFTTESLEFLVDLFLEYDTRLEQVVYRSYHFNQSLN